MSTFISNHRLIVGGVAVGLLGIGGYYVYQSRNTKFDNPYPRDLVISVLKDFRRDFKRVNLLLFQQVSKIRQMMSMSGRQLPPGTSDELMSMLIDENADFKTQIKRIEEIIYTKHKIEDKKRFERSCQETYKDDPEISILLKKMSTSLEDIMEGHMPTNDVQVHPTMTPAVVIDLIEKTSRNYVKNVLDLAEKFLLSKEDVSKNNLYFIRELTTVTPEDVKAKLIKEYGFEKLSDEPEEMLSKAIETYTKQSIPGFRQKMEEIEMRTRLVMQMIMNGGVSLEYIQKSRESLDKPIGEKLKSITETDNKTIKEEDQEDTLQGTNGNPSTTVFDSKVLVEETNENQAQLPETDEKPVDKVERTNDQAVAEDIPAGGEKKEHEDKGPEDTPEDAQVEGSDPNAEDLYETN